MGVPDVPRSWLAADGMWPFGPFAAGTPIAVRRWAGDVLAIWIATDRARLSVRRLARRAGVERQALVAALDGEQLPHLHVLVAVYEVLKPTWPVAGPQRR